MTHFGLFVELEGMPLEGMIRVERLGQDFFEYDAERQELRGVISNIAYRLGQRVQVRLIEVNPGRLEINLALLNSVAAPPEEENREKNTENNIRAAKLRPLRRAPGIPAENNVGNAARAMRTRGGPVQGGEADLGAEAARRCPNAVLHGKRLPHEKLDTFFS